MNGTIDFERARLRGHLRSLHDEVLDYSLDQRFARTLERAVVRAYGSESCPKALVSELRENDAERERFFSWALWDVRHDRGGSIGARFLREHGADLCATERRLAESHLAGAARFYEVRGCDAAGVRVRDVSTGREVLVTDPGGDGAALVTGVVVFGRLLAVDTWVRFERLLVVLSPARFAEVRARVGHLPTSDAAWTRAYPALLRVQDDVREAGVPLTTPEGESVVPCVAVFRLRTRGGVEAALRGASMVRRAGEGWLAVGRPLEPTTLGVATVHGRRLHVTCATVERAERVRREFEAALGSPEIVWLSTVLSNLDFVAIEMLEKMKLPEPYVHDPAIASALRAVVPEFLAEWWEVPNARLAGATPRESLEEGGRNLQLVRSFLRAMEEGLGSDALPLAIG